MSLSELRFPDSFLWGSATAAIQIEGAAALDGKGASVWDVFCREHPDRIFERATPEVACDHYHRYLEDVESIKNLGHNAYRCSISWPRLLPDGRGRVNTQGLDFYDRLFDALIARGIFPLVTLYHWDLPEALGSWESPEVVDAFLEYAALCYERFGDRVFAWCTLNEPGWTTLNGYVTGLHPPAKHNLKAAVLSSHHLMLAHHGACSLAPTDAQVGLALNVSPIYSASDRAEDVAAAHRADGVLNRWFFDAAATGRYPEDVVKLYDRLGYLPEGHDRLCDTARLDFLGVNYYYPHYAVAATSTSDFHLNTSGEKSEPCRFSLADCFAFAQNPRGRYTDWNWEIDPETLGKLLVDLSQRYPDLPLYVTENGLGAPDELVDGEVDDQARIGFVREHLVAIYKAIGAGADVRGYFMWSLMDNFSWINGYKKRYGFLYVDRDSLDRTPKKSAFWFRDIAMSNTLRC